jgi:hypothetical protein
MIKIEMGSKIFIVFILPLILSIAFASVTMGGVLAMPDRELNMWPMGSEGSSHSEISILGLEDSYSTSDAVEVRVKVSDTGFSCGDLYITISKAGSSDVMAQNGFFEQCFSANKSIPNGESFSEIIDEPGTYQIKAEMVSKELDSISVKETFIVK